MGRQAETTIFGSEFRIKQITKALDDALREQLWSYDTTEKVKTMLMNEKDAHLVKLRKKYEGTLLHMAVGYGAPVDVIQIILDKLPRSAKATTKKSKQTALHWGMDGRASSEAVEVVLKANPGAAKAQDSNGRLPLHLGLYRRAPLDAIRQVLEAYPDATQVQDNTGQLPLHSAVAVGLKQMIKSSLPWVQENVDLVAKQYPKAAEIMDKRGQTPLRILLKNGAPTRIVMTIVDACPSSLDVKDKKGRTIIHAAIIDGVPARQLAAIIERQHPSKVIAPVPVGGGADKTESTLAHLIMRHKESADAVEAILNAYQMSSNLGYKKPDNEGQTPLHIGMIHGASSSAIIAVLNAFPEAATIPDNLGETPLALGVRCGAPLDAIVPVLKAFPNATLLVDSSGDTPLHIAITKKLSCNVIEAILMECHDAGVTPNADGLSPLHFAIKQETPDIDICSTIIQRCPEASKTRDQDGNTPLLLLLLVTYGNDFRDITFPPVSQMKVVNQIWTKLSKVYPLAAEIENHAGISPISFLVSVCSLWAKDSAPSPWSNGACEDSTKNNGIKRSFTFVQLRALLGGLRDGRPLKKLCNLNHPMSLNLLLALFSEPVITSPRHRRHFSETDVMNPLQTSPRHRQSPSQSQAITATIDLNQEHMRGWTLLEILADLDNDDACNILLQIVEEQKAKIQEPDSVISIRYRFHDEKNPVVFRSKMPIREDTLRKVADRAKLSVGSKRVRNWGRVYGRFLQRYQIDKHKEPKHISETCVVVFATEARLDDSGRQYEKQVALKFLSDLGAFYREIDMRKMIAERVQAAERNAEVSSSPSVVPILAGYTSRQESEMKGDCDTTKVDSPSIKYGVDFSDLRSYKHIRLQTDGAQRAPKELLYLLVMECGAGLDLNDVISHQNIAGRDLPMVLAISGGIAKCLQFLNEDCHVCHGDVKARNFISLGVGAGYAAIDLDNAASIAEGGIVGKKRTSSGYMPPEQAVNEALRRKEENVRTEISMPTVLAELEDLETKIRVANAEGDYNNQLELLRAHKVSQDQLRQLQSGDIVAKPVLATASYDMWSFGVLLYYLCTGVQLFNMDFREDVNDTELAEIMKWNKDALLSKLKFVPEGWPRGLIADLLQPTASNRPVTWNDVVNGLQTVNKANQRQWDLPVADDPCTWSITYWQLMEVDERASQMFQDEYHSTTMRDIAAKIITPRCQESGCSFALSLNPGGLMVDAFVTHSWDEPFRAFVASIRKVFQTSVVKPNLWICAFALDQSNMEVVEAQVGSELTPLENSPFIKALEHALSFVVVRNSTTDLYSRIWCVCECLYAKKLGLVPNKSHVTGPSTFSQMRTSCLDAQATNPEDKKRILQVLLKEHKVEEIDAIVQLFRTQEAPE